LIACDSDPRQSREKRGFMAKHEKPVVVVVEGGIVQCVFRVDTSKRKGYSFVDYELVDYDVFETEGAKEIAEIWNGFSPELKAYFKKHLKNEYAKFRARIAEETECDMKGERERESL
jgi:hypothetical protein